MSKKIPLVTVVDDDESVRESLPDLIRELGFESRAYASAAEFLASADLRGTACLLLDVAMPGMTGPELLGELRRRGIETPVVFITALRNGVTGAHSVHEGVVDCLFKPFSETALLVALKAALRAA